MPKKKYTLTAVAMLVLGGLVVFAIIFATAKQRTEVSAIQKEITALQAEAEQVEQYNRDLTEKISFFDTDYFREREAKEKMNYQKEGERVVVVKKNIVPEQEEEAVVEAPADDAISDQPNYLKWFSQFVSD